MPDKKYPKVAVGVIIYNEEGQIFLAKSHKWKDCWIVPGGHLDWGETIENCVRREVLEETGLELEDIQRIDVQEAIFPEEFHEERHFIFFDYIAKAKPGDVVLNDELQEYGWFDPKDALDLELNKSTKRFIEKFISGPRKSSRQQSQYLR